jgi:hypothetical protein
MPFGRLRRGPCGIFDVNLGVVRWALRVGFYGYSALATDRYPPFSFDATVDYPATLDVPHPPTCRVGLLSSAGGCEACRSTSWLRFSPGAR